MSGHILKNLVTIRKTRGDVLKPVEYRTIVDMILGIMAKYDYSAFADKYRKFLNHLLDYDDPHHDAETNFLEEILSRIYSTYTLMLSTPVSYADFKTDIVTTPALLELIRRIVLNRYVYNQIKLKDGSIPTTASAYLSSDWGIANNPNIPTQITFTSPITSEADFIKAGWNGTTNPSSVIFNANNLYISQQVLPILFSTASDSSYLSFADTGVGYPIAFPSAVNELTVLAEFTGKPTTVTTLLILRNGTDTFSIKVNTNKTVSIFFNTTQINPAPIACPSGSLSVTLRKNGSVTLRILASVGQGVFQYNAVFGKIKPFTSGTLGLGLESLTSPSFGLHSLVIAAGNITGLDLNTYVTPLGYAMLIDLDGSYVTDPDGIPLMDYDISLPDGYKLLVDDDHRLMRDDDGRFVMDLIVPDGFKIVTESDFSMITDSDGAILIEPIS